mmetsp:Transcript_19164/g.18297  ORF Transcript_19164/g.18297 Transcript_19164/m.18297 type:complete len:88 (+) Transcript_19164:262-525(+)
MNYLEGISLFLAASTVAGIYYPIPASLIQAFYVLGRVIYSCFYALKGPNSRGFGAIMVDIALVGNIILAVLSCVAMLDDSKSTAISI